MIGLLAQELLDWDWVNDNLDEIWARGLEHVELTVLAVAIGFAISLPIAVAAHRRRALLAPVTFVTGVLYTIPSLALFVSLIPFTGLSYTTALIGLVGYTLLILIRNVVAGLESVPEDVRAAALGMGLGPRQMLWRVDLPLALPVIVAGVRVATVTTIGLVTVTALIGLGGFGHFILRGIRQEPQMTATIVGVVPSVVLAVVADAGLLAAQRWLMPWARREGRTTPGAVDAGVPTDGMVV
ncbi:MAG: ABC transporter permease [Actinomycetota bacterium]